MKAFIVDVPVKINIWIRVDFQRKQFEILKQARPSILFIQSDGGRNEKEWEAIRKNRRLFDEEIDWECKVFRIYEDHNNGMYAMARKVRKVIWENVDRCIFLEDDILPAVSYFQFCAELLERYKNDCRIGFICGRNNDGITEDASADYFFSHEGSIWGIATWKRVSDAVLETEAYSSDPYTMRLLKESLKYNKDAWKRVEGYAQDNRYEGHVRGPEFDYMLEVYGQHRLKIIPKKNMINNIGYGSDSEHAMEYKYLSKGTQKLFDQKTYEVEFPLKHMQFVVPDLQYEKRRNRALAVDRPLVKYYRKAVSLLRMLFCGDFGKIHNKISRTIKRNDRKEN